MTKKHFIELADVLRAIKPAENQYGEPDHADPASAYRAALAQWRTTVNGLCHFCAGTNPAFNAERWRDYINGDCGPSGGKVAK